MSRPRGRRAVPHVTLALAVVAGAVAAALATALFGLGGSAGPSPAPSPAPAVQPEAQPSGRTAAVARGAAGPAVSAEAAVLARWDARRATAYARGDPQRLRALYVRGSPAAVRDVAVLRSYLARGLRVRGLRMQMLAVEVREHRPGRIRLRVTDRAVGARAVGAGWSGPLPADQPTSRLVTLVRGQGSWQVSRVSGAAPR